MFKPWYLPHATIYREENGGDGGDAGGGGDGNGDAGGDGNGDSKPDPRLEALENAVRVLAQGQGTLNETLSTFAQKLEQIGKPPEGGNKKDDNHEDVDLETMDRKTFAAYMTSQLKGLVEDAMKPMGEHFGKLNEKIDAQGLSVMIKDFQKDHPDFFEWKGEMRELLKDTPTLTPARAYALVRAENAEKAKQLDKKYGLNKESKPNGSNTLLSLFPQGPSSATKGNGRMTPQQAAEAAWDEVMSNLNPS